MSRFSVTDQPIDADALKRAMQHDRAGAFICFEGWVRNHHQAREVLGLQYQAYSSLAEAEGLKIIDEAMKKFEVLDVNCIHRTGALVIGDCAVWVGVCASHRDAAFTACRYVIDEVKQRVPIWKKERYLEGDSQWLHPNA
jgi:molybdopterin synthase catalytic subunit